MIRTFFPAIVFILVCCCCHSKPQPRLFNADVQAVISASIKHTIGVGDTAKMTYRFPLPEIFDQGTYQKYYDSIKQLLDTSFAFITITDSAAYTLVGDKEEIGFAAEKFINPDNIRLARKILSDSSRDELDLKKIADSLQLPVKADHKRMTEDPRHIAKFSFSKIIFDETGNKAIVYQNYYCGGRCGFGELRLVEKKNGVWIVTESIRTWIS